MCQTCVPMSCVSKHSQCFHAPIWSFLAASPPAVHEASLPVTAPSKPESTILEHPQVSALPECPPEPAPWQRPPERPKVPASPERQTETASNFPKEIVFFLGGGGGGMGGWGRDLGGGPAVASLIP